MDYLCFLTNWILLVERGLHASLGMVLFIAFLFNFEKNRFNFSFSFAVKSYSLSLSQSKAWFACFSCHGLVHCIFI
ncbi:hypothetical protein AMTRI_Chr02g221200 [Amborella trichopoda]